MKKLFPAICMTLVAAALFATSTFAWFSMNTQVTATGMQITAQSNSTYLLIKETGAVSGDNEAAKANSIQTGNPITATLTVENSAAAVYPSKPYAESDGSKYGISATAVTTYATAAVAGNWFTANSLDPDKSTDNVTGATVLSSFDGYVIKKSVTLTVAAGADAAHNLSVTGTIIPKGLSLTSDSTAQEGKTYYTYSEGEYTKATVQVGTTSVTGMYEKATASEDPATINLTAVKVLVVTDDNNMTTLDYSKTNAQSLHATTDVTLNSSSIVVVDIYLYYDGTAAAVTSNNKANLGAAQIGLTFGVEVVTGA